MADIEVGDLVARISFDDTGLNRSMAEINRQMQLVQSEFDRASSSLSRYGSEEERLTAQSESLNRQMQLQQQRINNLNDAFQRSARETGEGSAATLRLATQLNRAQAEYNRLGSSLDDTTRSLHEQNGVIADNGSAWARNSDEFKAAGAALTGFGAGIASALGIAVKAAADSESQLAKLETVTKGNTEAAKEYLEWATKFGKTTPFEASEVVDATIKLKSYGLEAKDVLSNVGDLASSMGKGLDQAVEAVADAQTGELERLKEFGITKQQLIDQAAKMGKGEIVNAKGQITDLKALNAALFAIIEDRFKGSMDRQSKTLNGQISSLKDSFTQIATQIGNILMPVVTQFAGFMQGLADKFALVTPEMQKFITIGAVVAGAFSLLIGPVLLLIGFIPQIIAGFATLGPVLASLTGPIGLVVAAIAVLVAGIAVLYTKNEEFRKFVNDTWAAITASITDAVKNIAAVVEPGITAVVDFIKNLLTDMKVFWDDNKDEVLFILKALWVGTKFVFDQIVDTIKFSLGIIKGIFQIAWPIISNTVLLAWDAIKLIISTALDVIVGIIKTATKAFTGDWEGAWNEVKQTVKNVWENIENFLNGIDLKTIGQDIMQGLINGFSSMFGALKQRVKDAADSIKDGLKGFLGINSPSKVTTQIGEWTGEGLAIGMQRSLGSIASQAAAMSAAALPNPTTASYQASTTGLASGAANASAAQPQTMVAKVYLDSKQIATAIAQPQADTIRRRQRGLGMA